MATPLGSTNTTALLRVEFEAEPYADSYVTTTFVLLPSSCHTKSGLGTWGGGRWVMAAAAEGKGGGGAQENHPCQYINLLPPCVAL